MNAPRLPTPWAPSEASKQAFNEVISLLDLENKFLEATPRIERWFRLEWQEHTPPFYCSVDLRNAGFKLAPVDTNLYPGGFNNLSAEAMPLAIQAAMAAIEKGYH